MGNTFESHKIRQYVTEVAETTEVEESFLRNEFSALFETLIDLKKNKELKKCLDEILVELGPQQILNITNNLISYMNFQKLEEPLRLKYSLGVLVCVLDSIYLKFQNYTDLTLFSYEKFLPKSENIEMLQKWFPLNVFQFTVSTFVENDFYRKENFPNEIEIFEVTLLLSEIIFKLKFFFIMNNNVKDKGFIEYLDPIKIFLFSENVISRENAKAMLEKFFYNSFCNFNSFMSYRSSNIPVGDLELYIQYNLRSLIYFSYDINKFFFDEIKRSENSQLYFENKFNEMVYSMYIKLPSNLDDKISENKSVPIEETIQYCNCTYSNTITEVVLSNTNLFNNFVFLFFSNFDKFTQDFQLTTKIFFIYLFEKQHNICETICLQRGYLPLIMNRLNLDDIFDLMLLNKLTTSKNFYIMIKHLNSNDEADPMENTEARVQALCESCLDNILKNRNKGLQLNSKTYFLLLVVYNLSLSLQEMGDQTLLWLGEFITYFYDVEMKQENMLDNLVILKLYYEILLNFLDNLEFPSNLIIILLKFSGQLKKINFKYEQFYLDNCKSEGKIKETWEKYQICFKEVEALVDKFEKVIEDEGANVIFTQSCELIKIINKVSIVKKERSQISKENKIFNTETEKFIISNLMNAEVNINKILK